MQVIEVFGAPGVGKSALCNDLWPPVVPWDGLPLPDHWLAFASWADRIYIRTEYSHWRTMFEKACRKMATLSRAPGDGYVGVGLAQRGLDLCWRGCDINTVKEYCRRMPLPAGLVSLYADQATIRARNIGRGRHNPYRRLPHLAHLNDTPREIVTDALRKRGVPVLELDTRNEIAGNVDSIRRFLGGS